MVRRGVRRGLPSAHRRACEHASSKVAAVRSAGISPQPPAQMPEPQPDASAVLARRKIPTAAALRRYRCDRCPPPQSRAVGSTHKPEPSALLRHYDAIYRAKREQSPNRKLQMLLSAQRQTHESQLRRGRKAEHPLDKGSAHPDCSACGFRVCATRRAQGRWERQYKGYSRAAARGHPKHIDECHHLNPAASEEMEDATEQPTRAR